MTDNKKHPNMIPRTEYQRNRDSHKRAVLRNHRIRMVLLALIVVVFLVGIILVLVNDKKNRLTGTWVYDSYTQYIFTDNGDGCLEVDDVHYEYTYHIDGDTLVLDFTEDIVRDCKYTFSIRKNELTLIGGENTDGGTYTLQKSK